MKWCGGEGGGGGGDGHPGSFTPGFSNSRIFRSDYNFNIVSIHVHSCNNHLKECMTTLFSVFNLGYLNVNATILYEVIPMLV